jgi:hypothetical protein
MSRSVLLQLARDSIQEVLEAKNTIDKKALIELHPLLAQRVQTTVNIYNNKELHNSCTLENLALIDAIIIASKKAAFEGEIDTILTTSKYLHSEIELVLNTQEGTIKETDPAILHKD